MLTYMHACVLYLIYHACICVFVFVTTTQPQRLKTTGTVGKTNTSLPSFVPSFVNCIHVPC